MIGEFVSRSRDPKMDYLRLALSFEALGGGLWEYDIDTEAFSCNQRSYEILGIDESSTPIRSLQALHPHVHPEDARRVTKLDLDKVLQWLANDEFSHVDFRIVRPAGEVRWIRSMACFVRDAESGHRKAVGCVADITEFRQSEPTSIFEHLSTGVHGDRALTLPERSETTFKPSPRLTLKEKECLTWVSLGKTASESGIILGKSSRTVEFHLNNAIRKLGVVNKIHAVAIAIRMGLI